jgi:hypothetical protein
MASPPTTLSESLLVASLPLPPDVAALVERCCRSDRLSARERAAVEEEFKLSLYPTAISDPVAL